jgi:DNA-binding response OmpR family regulator
MPGARILVVDDEPAIRLLCRVNLQADGFSVKEAVDGAAAMLTAREWKPDLILLDVMMPGEDGFAIAERIRDDPDLAGMRVLFLTARADIDDRARRSGAVGYVTKPFNPSTLGTEVRAALER